MPKYLVEIDAEAKDGHSEQPGSSQVARLLRDHLIRDTDADSHLTWQVLQVREVPIRPGPGWEGYRDVTVAVTVHVPAATSDHAVTEAVDNVLGDPAASWGSWLVGAARPITRGYPDPGLSAGPPGNGNPA